MNEGKDDSAGLIGDMPSGAPVILQRYKYGGVPHYRHEGIVLGADSVGTWVAIPPQPLMRDGAFVLDITWWTLQLVPRRDPWCWAAFFQDRVGNYDIYVDICTGCKWTGSHVSMVDLDLDVVRLRHDGSVAVIDHDDLERHTMLLGDPAELVERTHEAAERVRQAIVAGERPFAGSSELWMSELESVHSDRDYSAGTVPT